MEKLLVMNIAAQLTEAACGNVGSGLAVSPDLQDPAVRAKNLHVWETFRVFYRGVAAALADSQSWPSPKVDVGSVIPPIMAALAPFLGQLGPLGDLLKKALAALPAPTPPPAGPLPDPGVAPK